MMIVIVGLLILVLELSFTTDSSSDIFSGELTYQILNNDSPQFRQWVGNSPSRLDQKERYLNTSKKITINKDTIIIERFDSYGELYMLSIKYGNNIFTNSGSEDDIYNSDFADVSNFKYEMNAVKSWKKIDENYFRGFNNSTVLEIEIDPNKRYNIPNRSLGGFSEVFHKKRLIKYQSRMFREDVRETTLVSIEEKSVNCKELMWKYDFRVKD